MEFIGTSIYLHPNTTVNDLDNSIARDPLLQLSALNKTELSILNTLFRLSASYQKVYVSQTTLASWLGLTRRQVNRVISKLSSLGIIDKYHRTYDTCIYLVDDFFKSQNIKNLLKQLLPNIVKLAFSVGQLLFAPLRRNTRMEKKNYSRYEKKRTFSAGYHEPWVEGKSSGESLKPSGFRHISEAFCPVAETFKEHTTSAPEPEAPCIHGRDDNNLLGRLGELAELIPHDKFDRLLKSGRTLKERVKMCENYYEAMKIKENCNV